MDSLKRDAAELEEKGSVKKGCSTNLVHTDGNDQFKNKRREASFQPPVPILQLGWSTLRTKREFQTGMREADRSRKIPSQLPHA
jgi:hypothetical protein